MGDKSPKSKQKSQGQKQTKTNSSNKEKQRAIDKKKSAGTAPTTKKK